MEEDTCVLHLNAKRLNFLVNMEHCMDIFEMNAYKLYAAVYYSSNVLRKEKERKATKAEKTFPTSTKERETHWLKEP
eukprot:544742-Pelagomonas_calceolata.AAC.2